MSIFRFFTKPSSEDPIKIINLIDEEKPMSKRYVFMINYITKLSKPDEKFNLRLYDFFKDHGETVLIICLAHIHQSDSKLKIKSWEDVSNTFCTLQEFTRYGHFKKIEPVQNIAKLLLQDGNRIELKKIGLTLIMNVITHNENLKVPFEIFLATVDLSLTNITSPVQLPTREILAKQSDVKWLNIIRDLLKSYNSYQYLEIIKVSDHIKNFDLMKEPLILFKSILEYTLEGGVTENGLNIFDHFHKWFRILKQTYLLYLYPDLGNVDFNKGFMECPDIYHFIVVIWINKFIEMEDINSNLFIYEADRTLILKILEKSFLWLSSTSKLSQKSAIQSFKIFRNWLNYIKYPTLKELTKEHFSLICLNHISCVFTMKAQNFPERTEICLKSQELFKIFNQNFKDNPNLFKLLLTICEGLDSRESHEKLFENFLGFLLKILKTANWNKLKTLKEFEYYLHKWCEKYVSLFQIWKKNLLEIIESPNMKDLADSSMLIQIFKIIGNGVEFNQNSQVEWASSVHEVIQNMLEKRFAPFFVLELFFEDLSKIVLIGEENASMICLNAICQVFSRDSLGVPSLLQTRHFFYIIAQSINKKFLVETILRHSSIILDYTGMHSLAELLLGLAFEYPVEGLQTIFKVISFPNHYKTTTLLGLNKDKSNYLKLKPAIFKFFCNSRLNPPPYSLLDGLTVFIIEEIANDCEEYVEKGVDLLLNNCTHPDSNISSTALLNISIIVQTFSTDFNKSSALVQIIPKLHLKILEFLVTKVMKPKKIDKENLIVNIVDATVSVMMNLKVQVDEGILKVLFQRICKFGVLLDENSKLKSYFNTIISLLGFYYLNFPFPYTSIEIFDSDFEMLVNKNGEYFIMNKNTLVCVYKDKFLIRNQFGKFLFSCQNYSIFNSETFSDDKSQLRQLLNRSQFNLQTIDTEDPLKNSPSIEFLLLWIQKTYDLNSNESFNIPETLEVPELPPLITKCERKQTNFNEQDENVENISKIFLANLGLLNGLNKLEINEQLERSISLLDGVKSREQLKIAVLYVKQGQDCEKLILANSTCSQGFKLFLQKLGKPVNLESHPCNLGALDPNGTCGRTSIAYIDWEVEIMFHVPVLMPTDPSDPQQVLKKRHVGNDLVSIVWSENWKEYRPDTFVTHFNFVNIIIYPTGTQLYRICIQNKLNLNFGPLKDGMVVNWKILPFLIRSTAINANKAIKVYKFPMLEKQTMIRQKKILEIYSDQVSEKDKKGGVGK